MTYRYIRVTYECLRVLDKQVWVIRIKKSMKNKYTTATITQSTNHAECHVRKRMPVKTGGMGRALFAPEYHEAQSRKSVVCSSCVFVYMYPYVTCMLLVVLVWYFIVIITVYMFRDSTTLNCEIVTIE